MSSPAPALPVLVTRLASRGGALVAALAAQGLTVHHHPLLRIEHVSDAAMRTARAELAAGGYSHLVVTSRTAVEALLALAPGNAALTISPSTQVIAVGDGTAASLAQAGVTASMIAGGSGAALVREMPAAGPVGAGAGRPRVLFPASAAAAPTVPEGLVAKGYDVHRVIAYRPHPVPLPADAASALRTGGYGAIVLTSPNLADQAARSGIHPATAIVTIGEPTSARVRALGLEVAEQAAEPTDAALARSVLGRLGMPAAPPAPGS